MSTDYNAYLKDGREIYILHWPVNVALENLARAGQYLGATNIIKISELDIPAVIVAVMGTKEPELAVALMKHFVCQVRISGAKIDPSHLDEMFKGNLHGLAELFAHVITAQYADFFASGLARVSSPA